MSTNDQPQFDPISYEDVLAARVLKKALGAVAVLLTFASVVLAIAWIDINTQRTEIDSQREALNRERTALQDDVKSLRSDFSRARDSLMHQMEQAGGIVANAHAYHAALAAQLVEFGKMQAVATQVREEIGDVRRDAENAVKTTQQLQYEHKTRIASDTASLREFRTSVTQMVGDALEQARTVNHHVLNRWSQVVDENRRTPLADSRFFILFDEVTDAVVSGVQLSYEDSLSTKKTINLLDGYGEPLTQLQLNRAKTFEWQGQQYEIVAQLRHNERATLRHLPGPDIPLPWHNDRAVFQLNRITQDTTGVRSASRQ